MTASAGLPDRQGIGILCIVIGMLAISIQDALIKGFSGSYPLHEIVLIRSLVALPFMFVILQFEGGWRRLMSRRMPLLLVRALFIVVSNSAYFAALAGMPLAEANAIFFVAPLFITVLSIPMLGEKVGPWRWGAVFVGFAGIVVMLRPGDGIIKITALLPVLAAFTYAMMQMLTRKLGVTESASVLAISIYLTFVVVCLLMFLICGDGRFVDKVHPSLNFLFLPWKVPPLTDWPALGGIGLLSGMIGYMLAQAYRMGEAGLIAPFEYVAVPLAVFWGFMIFDEVPDMTTWTGILLIVGSGLFIVYREVRRKRPISRPRAADTRPKVD